MKITNIFKCSSIVTALVLAFGVMAAPAHAQYGYGYNQPYYGQTGNYYGTPSYSYAPAYQQSYPSTYYTSNSGPLQVNCYAVNPNVSAGTAVQWYASAYGGNNSYYYTWTGTDGLSGYGQSVSKVYYSGGFKNATVTVTSGGQTVSKNCDGVNVTGGSYNYPTYPAYQPAYVAPQPVIQTAPVVVQAPPIYINQTGLDIGCYADPSKAVVNQPITWNAEVTGGAAPFTYSWTGTDGLTGSGASVIKFYGSNGTKSAIVTVTSADGKTGVRACSNTVTVGSAAKAPAKSVAKPAPANSSLTASSVFSLANVPWGLIAILVILVLFATVMYLLFNKQKI